MEYLHETDLSTCILHDNMKPGVWIAAQAATNTMIRVSVAPDLSPARTQPVTDSSSTAAPTPIPSQLFLEKKLAIPSGPIKGIVQLRAETEPNSNPVVSGSVQLTNSSSLFASISSCGLGWLGAHYDRTFAMDALPIIDAYANDPFQTAALIKPYEGLDTMCRSTVNFKLGSWMPLQWRDPFNKRRKSDVNALHGYAAVNMLGATAAIHGKFDTSYERMPIVRSYFSANLNDIDRPPLQITLERFEDKASISLSQVLAFDRWQLNPVEDRAPKVRNTLAWTVRMENLIDNDIDTSFRAAEDSGAHYSADNNTKNRLSLGAAWQINRGLAVKAVLLPQEQCLTAAILMKRWRQPRVTCSLLGCLSKTNGFQFLGIGVELETGNVDTHPDAYYYNHHPSQETVIVEENDSVPQTRAVLPSELKSNDA